MDAKIIVKLILGLGLGTASEDATSTIWFYACMRTIDIDWSARKNGARPLFPAHDVSVHVHDPVTAPLWCLQYFDASCYRKKTARPLIIPGPTLFLVPPCMMLLHTLVGSRL